jgi:hypothetical protein
MSVSSRFTHYTLIQWYYELTTRREQDTMTRSLRGGAIGVVRGRTTAKEWAVAVRLDPLESIDL